MPRGGTRTRRLRQPTEEDLTDSQREYFSQLPEPLREGFLRQLPPVSISTAGNQKKSNLIRERISLLDRVVADLQNHRKELTQLARNLDQGSVSAGNVDLRTALRPPSIDGISMRYVRSRRG